MPAPAAWPTWVLVLVIAAGLGLAIGFAGFGSEVLERETTAFDRAVREWTLAHRTPFGSSLFAALTWLGSIVVLLPLTLVVATMLVRRGAVVRPLLIAGAPAAFAVVIALLKRSYGVRRPPAGVAAKLSASFPSGHAAGSAAVALVLGYVLLREGLAPRGAALVAAFVVVLVGVSRIYLDVHWASDVLGGWVVGVAFGASCCALYEIALRRAAMQSR